VHRVARRFRRSYPTGDVSTRESAGGERRSWCVDQLGRVGTRAAGRGTDAGWRYAPPPETLTRSSAAAGPQPRSNAGADLVEILAKTAVRVTLAPVGDLRIDAQRLERGVAQHLLDQADIPVGCLEQRGRRGVARGVRAAQVTHQREEVRRGAEAAPQGCQRMARAVSGEPVVGQ